jgi:hypothetical protein
MIVETIIAGLTLIFVSSLAFANTQIRRQRQWEKEDSEEEFDPIRPFLRIAIGVGCPLCGRAAEKNEGLRQPKTCPPKEKCEVSIPHLHVECTWCNSKWLMKTADQKEKKDDH